MRLKRRSFLKLAGLVATAANVSACTPLYAKLSGFPRPWDTWMPDGGDHFKALSRLTFGPRLAERIEVQEIGLPAWIEAQLASETIADPATWRLRPLEALKLDADTLSTWEKDEVVRQLKQGTLLRHIFSRKQLYEIMVSFWSDHFNIFVEKGDCWFLKVVDDREVIRRHALGNFRDLLWASAHSPAMLVYLDNQVNKKEAPNENYARELLELHTLGVEGGFTQNDVMELARCLTGWTVKDHFWRGEFAFDPERHDQGLKTVLGRTIEPAGQGEAESVLEELALHPSTARQIAFKLVRRFLGDQPGHSSQALVERAAGTFLRTRGDIQAVLRTVLYDGLLVPGTAGAKLKRPIEFVVSALRILNADTNAHEALQAHLTKMGQGPFEWPMPDGPPDEASAWSAGLLPRWTFALELARNEIQGVKIKLEELIESSGAVSAPDIVDNLSWLLLGATLPSESRRSMVAKLDAAGVVEAFEYAAIFTAGIVASPGFQWR